MSPTHTKLKSIRALYEKPHSAIQFLIVNQIMILVTIAQIKKLARSVFYRTPGSK